MIEKLYYVTVLSLMGASIGSFLVCWAYRRNRGISIVKVANSFCDNCGRKLNVISLIPVLGTLINKGKCKDCGKSYSKVSFSVELVYAVITPVIFYDLNVIAVSTALFIVIALTTFTIVSMLDLTEDKDKLEFK